MRVAADCLPAIALALCFALAVCPAGAAGTGSKSKFDISTGPQVVHRISVELPANGVVVVNASGHFRFGSAATSANCGLATKETLSGPVVPGAGFNDNAENREAFAISRAVSSKKGGNRTYKLVCSAAPGADVDVLSAVMTAIYAPMNIKTK